MGRVKLISRMDLFPVKMANLLLIDLMIEICYFNPI